MKVLVLDGSPAGNGAALGAPLPGLGRDSAGDAGVPAPQVEKGAAPAASDALGVWSDRYAAALESRGVEVARVALAGLGVKPCTGCWSCWLATPGRCVRKDGLESIYPKVLAADLVVWAFPLVLGAQNALTKTVQDRMIPLLHPYIELVAGECHHRGRYARYPLLAAVVAPGNGDGPEDILLVRTLFERFALNFRSRPVFFSTVRDTPEEAADASRSA